jgi:hypothetical protein
MVQVWYGIFDREPRNFKWQLQHRLRGTSKHKSMLSNFGRPGGRSNLWPSIEKQCRDKNSMTQLLVVNQQPPPSGNTLYTFTINVSQNFRNKFKKVSEIIKCMLDHSKVHAVLTNLKIQSDFIKIS